MTHEWGHALGIAHNGDYNVMDEDWIPTIETEPRCPTKRTTARYGVETLDTNAYL
ncbi:MAG TPA: hypothetical protein VF230_11020 [Acidimicrobiales bacterium]